MTNRKIEYWVIPSESDAEFTASMEEVLDTYSQPYDAAKPVLCMDEQPVQLLKVTREPIPATATHARRVDYQYERAGTATIFMFNRAAGGLARRPGANQQDQGRLGPGDGGVIGREVCRLSACGVGVR